MGVLIELKYRIKWLICYSSFSIKAGNKSSFNPFCSFYSFMVVGLCRSYIWPNQIKEQKQYSWRVEMTGWWGPSRWLQTSEENYEEESSRKKYRIQLQIINTKLSKLNFLLNSGFLNVNPGIRDYEKKSRLESITCYLWLLVLTFSIIWLHYNVHGVLPIVIKNIEVIIKNIKNNVKNVKNMFLLN